MSGPPFSISAEEVHHHYGDRYEVSQLVSQALPGGLKGQLRLSAQKTVWALKRN